MASDEKREVEVLNEEELTNLYEHRDKLERLAESEQGEYDKQIMALASSALALSFAVFGKIDEPVKPMFFTIAVSSFSASLIAVLVSHLTSSTDMRFGVAEVDRVISGNASEVKRHTSMLTHVVTALNVFGLLSLLVGVVCLTVFASAQVNEASKGHPSISGEGRSANYSQNPSEPINSTEKQEPGNEQRNEQQREHPQVNYERPGTHTNKAKASEFAQGKITGDDDAETNKHEGDTQANSPTNSKTAN